MTIILSESESYQRSNIVCCGDHVFYFLKPVEYFTNCWRPYRNGKGEESGQDIRVLTKISKDIETLVCQCQMVMAFHDRGPGYIWRTMLVQLMGRWFWYCGCPFQDRSCMDSKCYVSNGDWGTTRIVCKIWYFWDFIVTDYRTCFASEVFEVVFNVLMVCIHHSTCVPLSLCT